MGNNLSRNLEHIDELEEYITKIFYHLDDSPRKDYLNIDDILHIIPEDIEDREGEVMRMIQLSGYHENNTLSLDEFIYVMGMACMSCNGDNVYALKKLLNKITNDSPRIPINERRDDIIVITAWNSAPCSLFGSDVHVYIRSPNTSTPRDSIGVMSTIVTSGENITLTKCKYGARVQPGNILVMPFFWEEHGKVTIPLDEERSIIIGYGVPFVLKSNKIRRIDTRALTKSRYIQRYRKFGLNGNFSVPDNLTVYSSVDLSFGHINVTPDGKGLHIIILLK